MNLVYSILSFLLAADYETIRLCPIDYARQRKRVLFSAVVSLVTFLVPMNMVMFPGDTPAIVPSIIAFVLYITFLCKYEGSALFKCIIGLAISAFIFYNVSYYVFGGLEMLTCNSTEGNFVASMIGIFILVLCFIPINFADECDYVKLYKCRIAGRLASAKIRIEEKNKADKEIAKNEEEERVKLAHDVAKFIRKRLLQAQVRAVDRIISQWENENCKDIENDISHYVTSEKSCSVTINKTAQEEVATYISNLLEEKYKEFARVIVEKWAKEKLEQLTNNPNAFFPQSKYNNIP